MHDSFSHHKSRENLQLLKSTLVSRPVKVLPDSGSGFPAKEAPPDNYNDAMPVFKPKFLNAFFKETSTYRLTPEKALKIEHGERIKGLEHRKPKILANSSSISEKRPEERKSSERTNKMPVLRVHVSNDTKKRFSGSDLNRNKGSQTKERSLTSSTILLQTSTTKEMGTDFNIDAIMKKENRPKIRATGSLNINSSKNFSTSKNPIRAFTSNSINTTTIINVSSCGEKPITCKLKKTPKVKAKSWIIMDATSKKIINSQKPRKPREIASLTKIMTCYVACSLIERFEMDPCHYQIKVSKGAVRLGGTSAGLEHGDRLTVRDLLFGLMLPSGNDAAYCLADFFGKLAYILYQDEKARPFGRKKEKFSELYRERWFGEFPCKDFVKFFVCEMNKMARNHGLLNTVFNNPHGLPDSLNKSTAEDVAKISISAMKSKLFREVMNCKEYYTVIQDKNKENREVCWRNLNELLSKGFDGIKTGNTPTAGPCMAAHFEKEGVNVVIIVLKTKNEESRFAETLKLLRWFMKSRTEDSRVL